MENCEKNQKWVINLLILLLKTVGASSADISSCEPSE